MPGSPLCGDSVMETTLPPPAGIIAFVATACVISHVPSTLSRMTVRKPFGVIVSAGMRYWPPALLTSRSMRPWRSSTPSTSASTWSSSRMSHGLRRRRARPASCAVSCSGSSRRPQRDDASRPARVSSSVVARPMPGPGAGDDGDLPVEHALAEQFRSHGVGTVARMDLVERIHAPSRGPHTVACFDYDGTLIDGFSAKAFYAHRIRHLQIGPFELARTLLMSLQGIETDEQFEGLLDDVARRVARQARRADGGPRPRALRVRHPPVAVPGVLGARRGAPAHGPHDRPRLLAPPASRSSRWPSSSASSTCCARRWRSSTACSPGKTGRAAAVVQAQGPGPRRARAGARLRPRPLLRLLQRHRGRAAARSRRLPRRDQPRAGPAPARGVRGLARARVPPRGRRPGPDCRSRGRSASTAGSPPRRDVGAGLGLLNRSRDTLARDRGRRRRRLRARRRRRVRRRRRGPRAPVVAPPRGVRVQPPVEHRPDRDHEARCAAATPAWPRRRRRRSRGSASSSRSRASRSSTARATTRRRSTRSSPAVAKVRDEGLSLVIAPGGHALLHADSSAASRRAPSTSRCRPACRWCRSSCATAGAVMPRGQQTIRPGRGSRSSSYRPWTPAAGRVETLDEHVAEVRDAHPGGAGRRRRVRGAARGREHALGVDAVDAPAAQREPGRALDVEVGRALRARHMTPRPRCQRSSADTRPTPSRRTGSVPASDAQQRVLADEEHDRPRARGGRARPPAGGRPRRRGAAGSSASKSSTSSGRAPATCGSSTPRPPRDAGEEARVAGLVDGLGGEALREQRVRRRRGERLEVRRDRRLGDAEAGDELAQRVAKPRGQRGERAPRRPARSSAASSHCRRRAARRRWRYPANGE